MIKNEYCKKNFIISYILYFSYIIFNYFFKFRHSKENHIPNTNYYNINLVKKKRSIIDEETKNIIKRFKKDTNHTNIIQSLHNKQFNHINNIMKEKPNILPNFNNKNIMQYTNLLSSNILDKNFRYILIKIKYFKQ